MMIAIDDGILTTIEQVYAKAYDDGLSLSQIKGMAKYFNEGNTDDFIREGWDDSENFSVENYVKLFTNRLRQKTLNKGTIDILGS